MGTATAEVRDAAGCSWLAMEMGSWLSQRCGAICVTLCLHFTLFLSVSFVSVGLSPVKIHGKK